MVDAVTQTKISTELTTPLTVPPPTGGLGSNSNYVLSSNPSSQCTPITGLTVTIDITQDLVLKSSTSFFVNGYSIQLNCSSPPGFINAWQQFVFLIYTPDIGYSELDVAVNDYTVKEDELLNDLDTVLRLPSNTLPAGYQLQIQLKTDANNNVVGAQYVVNDIGFPPTLTTPLTGYTLPDTSAPNNYRTPTEQHINYIGIDGHIHERFHRAEGNWIHNDLSVIAGSSIFPAANSALDAYADLDLGQHVNFIGTDGHVHELYIAQGGHWIDNDLNQLSKGVSVSPTPGSPLDGYVDSDKGQHVNFIGTDGHVHELFIASGGHWINNDLSVLSGNGIMPRPNSPLDGYIDDDNGQHVNFIGTDGHIHELYITPHGHWINNDLTVLSGNGITPSRTSSLCGYMAQDNGQHVNFIGTDGHVHELYIHPGAQWINNDLIVLSGNGVPPAPESPLIGCWTADGTQHVNFTGTDGHVHELSIAPHGHWINNDLTVLSANNTTPAPNGALSSYMQPNGDLHVNFIGVNDAHLHELLLVPSAQWVNNDLNHIELLDHPISPLDLAKDQFAPICAFELNLVGPYNADTAVFSAGAGNFTYTAATPLTVLNNFPPCAPFQLGTAEKANSVYGTLEAGPSNTITQTFSIDTSAHIIHFQGPVTKGTRLAIKHG
jgi:hypothetical protein